MALADAPERLCVRSRPAVFQYVGRGRMAHGEHESWYGRMASGESLTTIGDENAPRKAAEEALERAAEDRRTCSVDHRSALPAKHSKIRVCNVAKAFKQKSGPVLALDDISFEVSEGEFVCIVGPSGCGKTTLLRILAGLEKQTSGKVFISVGTATESMWGTGDPTERGAEIALQEVGGRESREAGHEGSASAHQYLVRYRALGPGEDTQGEESKAYMSLPNSPTRRDEDSSAQTHASRPLVSVVFQEQSLLPWMTVRGNVEYGLRLRGVPSAERRRTADHYIDLMGLSEFAQAYPHQLSGGMKQRASVARAFANDPEILLMDEPFGSLDEQNRMLLQQELLRIWEQSRKTAVFITHSIDEAIALGDRVLVMTARPGRIKASIAVTLARPRQVSEIRGEPGFLPLFNAIRTLLSEEVLRAREIESSGRDSRRKR